LPVTDPEILAWLDARSDDNLVDFYADEISDIISHPEKEGYRSSLMKGDIASLVNGGIITSDRTGIRFTAKFVERWGGRFGNVPMQNHKSITKEIVEEFLCSGMASVMVSTEIADKRWLRRKLSEYAGRHMYPIVAVLVNGAVYLRRM
jgi:hypothetical protein